MNKESKNFLRELHLVCGTSGFEEDPQKIWVDRTKKYADSVSVDVMGNAIASLNEEAKVRVMLDSHIDEIGFIVNYISDEGFIHLEAIGSPDEVVLCGSRIRVHTDKGNIEGVLGKKVTHLEEEEDTEKTTLLKDLWLDIGAKDKKDVKSNVSVGDWATFVPNFMDMRNDIFTSKSADNRVGSFVMSEVLKILSKKKSKLNVAVFASSSVQEEVGLRGAKTSAYSIQPNIGIAVDLTWSSDTPFSEKKEVGDISLGKGPVLHPGPVTNRKIYKLMTGYANKAKIKYQVQPIGSTDGTDADMIQTSRGGLASALVSIPSRYMHTPVEMCAYKDIELAAKLIAGTILKINSKSDFIPS